MLALVEKRGIAWQRGGTGSILNLWQQQRYGDWRKSKFTRCGPYC